MRNKKLVISEVVVDRVFSVVGLVTIVLVFFLGEWTFADQPGDLKRQFESINQRMQQNMLQSNKQLEMGAFHKAREYTDSVLEDLDRLIEATVPLRERIAQLLEKEEAVLLQTGQLIAEQPDFSGSTVKSRIDDLIRDQIQIRKQTETASNLVSRQLIANMSGQSNTGVEAKPPSDALKAVKSFIDQSASFQTSAISSLEDHSLASAKKKEASASESLKKALEKLQQNAQAGSEHQNQTDSQSGHQTNNQQSSDKQQQSSSQQASKQEQDNTKAQAMENDKAKMSPREALKELQRIRKQAKDEKASRAEQFGAPIAGQQLPVDKDW
jgi:hypothetical protein